MFSHRGWLVVLFPALYYSAPGYEMVLPSGAGAQLCLTEQHDEGCMGMVRRVVGWSGVGITPVLSGSRCCS